MEFRLTAELIDTIIYSMENQGEDCIFDIASCCIVSKEEVASDQEETRFVELPVWGPSQGYQLMENFVANLRNPIYREMLKEALSSGKGVFRKFKDVIKKRDDIERLWFNFKEKEMRRLVSEWYELTCERIGLEKLGEEPEITEELVLSDFTIHRGLPEQYVLFKEMDRKAFRDSFPEAEEAFVEDIYREKRENRGMEPEPLNFIFYPEGPEKEIAGFIWGEDRILNERKLSRIRQLYILPEYRGLGLAKLLLDYYKNAASERGIDEIFIEISGSGLNLSRFLENNGFKVFSTVYSIHTGF